MTRLTTVALGMANVEIRSNGRKVSWTVNDSEAAVIINLVTAFIGSLEGASGMDLVNPYQVPKEETE